MISPKHLRIGNLIQDNFGQIRKVTCIYESGTLGTRYVTFDSPEMAAYPEHPTFDGIPLTEEWLLNLGLIDSDRISIFGSFEKASMSGVITIGCSNNGSQYTGKQNAVYVHELQNLYFCLTGKELQFKQTQ